MIALVNKWLHLLSMIGVLGSIMLAFMAILPATNTESESPLVKDIWKRFGMFVGGLWVVVLLTGFYNMSLVSESVNGKYQMWLGMKMALAIIMFLITLIVGHPIPALSKITKNRAPILMVLIVFGVIIVGISAKLNVSRVTGTGLKEKTPLSAPAVNKLAN